MYKQINLLNGEKYYMEAERFAKRGNLISKLSSNMFFTDEQLYEPAGKDKIKLSTALISIESICSIVDTNDNLTII